MLSADQDLVSQLIATHPRFQSLYEKHHQLDKEISKLEGPSGAGYNEQVAKLKKEKLHLKDEMQRIMQTTR
ncbi:Uncharacterized protein conserved in bacteria [Providencia rustigianii]|uniref:DUF465 domain-containing protein n=2 Tax=Providencia rustigianii TaxID=158850 RepID=D1P3Q2_9GAMM|nr:MULTISPECIES: DUF465 domain-containing protein [Providencia]EFB72168.1 hypothetical protein PROVRUST_06923 [Providencia rustigianii DSM 4541]MTC55311.1 DUF465 domain-containing protein [Providencia rustigianii]MTC58526.1 DUF465 domain-containing protein [Providencia rustigianii]SPY78285.1 Uncharacterized protein conserved in bacteria [Providencia rustigianii]SUC27906.1 Uncharacterized protein conserved in bacteria [Providencia rustigianii]